MDKQKLLVVIMGQDCQKFIEMSLESVKEADVIVYCSGGVNIEVPNSETMISKNDDALPLVHEYQSIHKYPIKIISNKYSQEDPQMNGKQRNFYLNYLKENYPDYWCLAIDADEVVEDLNKIKELIQTCESGLFQVKMRHFHNDLGHEDSTEDTHYVLNRLFKISEADSYPLVEHPILQGKEGSKYFKTDVTVIWHLAHIDHVFSIKKRYEKQIKHSNIHTPEFLDNWNEAHCLGTYPNKQVNILEVPDVITNYFHINKSRYYYQNRQLENKHWIDARYWLDFFKCESAIEVGCGLGPRVFAMNYIGIKTDGFEISEYAVKHRLHPNVFLGDLVNIDIPLTYDLAVAYDLLEHIKYNEIDKAINNLIKLSNKHILISVPVIGDPNLEADRTHKIRETGEWWIKQFTQKGLKLIPTPEHFLASKQVFIFEK
jgi:hypothetical protein